MKTETDSRGVVGILVFV